MSNYLKIWEVLKYLDIEIFELFDLCKKRKLQAYNEHGKGVVDPDSCKKGKKDFVEFLWQVEREEGGKAFRNAYRRNHCSSPEDMEKPLTREEIETKARERYNAQPDTPIIPENRVEFDFTIPARPSIYQTSYGFEGIREQKIKEAEAFIFKKSDIEKLKIEYTPKKEMGTRERENLLRLIGAFIEKCYQDTKYKNKDNSFNVSAISEEFSKWLASNHFSDKGIGQESLRKIIPKAYNLLMESRIEPEKEIEECVFGESKSEKGIKIKKILQSN